MAWFSFLGWADGAAPRLKLVPDLNRRSNRRWHDSSNSNRFCFQVGEMYADMQTSAVIWSIRMTVRTPRVQTSESYENWWVSSLGETSIEGLLCLCLGRVLDTDTPLEFRAAQHAHVWLLLYVKQSDAAVSEWASSHSAQPCGDCCFSSVCVCVCICEYCVFLSLL